jgi:hypothetical protein
MTNCALAQATPDTGNRGYNLFRNRQRPALVCAVPEDYPVPSFIAGEDWVFKRSLRPADVPPQGFDAAAALAGVRFNGFYLFQLTHRDADRSIRRAAA